MCQRKCGRHREGQGRVGTQGLRPRSAPAFRTHLCHWPWCCCPLQCHRGGQVLGVSRLQCHWRECSMRGPRLWMGTRPADVPEAGGQPGTSGPCHFWWVTLTKTGILNPGMGWWLSAACSPCPSEDTWTLVRRGSACTRWGQAGIGVVWSPTFMPIQYTMPFVSRKW